MFHNIHILLLPMNLGVVKYRIVFEFILMQKQPIAEPLLKSQMSFVDDSEENWLMICMLEYVIYNNSSWWQWYIFGGKYIH